MKVLIVEDEQHAVENLRSILSELPYEIQVVEVLDSVRTTIDFLKQKQVDLIFMDIQLGDGISFDIFDQIEVNTPIIFTTAYDEYALKAFKLNSIDYLLKPLQKDEVNAALLKFSRNEDSIKRDLKDIIAKLRNPEKEYQKRFMVSTGSQIHSIASKDLQCFVADGRYVSMIDKEAKRFFCDQTLEKLENSLDPIEFFRINRSIIVSFSAIQKMETYSKSRIKIKLKNDPGFDLIVSIDRAADFRRWLSR